MPYFFPLNFSYLKSEIEIKFKTFPIFPRFLLKCANLGPRCAKYDACTVVTLADLSNIPTGLATSKSPRAYLRAFEEI